MVVHSISIAMQVKSLQTITMHSIANDPQQSHIKKVKSSSGKEVAFEFCPIPAQNYYLGKYLVTQQQWKSVKIGRAHV